MKAYLAGQSWPDFQGIIIGAADDPLAAELEAGDDVIIMTFQNLNLKWEIETRKNHETKGINTLTSKDCLIRVALGTPVCRYLTADAMTQFLNCYPDPKLHYRTLYE